MKQRLGWWSAGIVGGMVVWALFVLMGLVAK